MKQTFPDIIMKPDILGDLSICKSSPMELDSNFGTSYLLYIKLYTPKSTLTFFHANPNSCKVVFKKCTACLPGQKTMVGLWISRGLCHAAVTNKS